LVLHLDDIACSCLLDRNKTLGAMHAGIVVGEAAVVGDHVTIMQHVTLGGTGNEPGDRHPKIGDYVQIGVKATILGGHVRFPHHDSSST
jgi:serine acetyltransferase